MKTIKICSPSGPSVILINESLASLGDYAPLERTVIVTDDNVLPHCPKDFPAGRVIAIRPGEKSKRLATVRRICLRLMEMGADRSSFLVGLGGGVVSDITGFSASIYMRGIPFGFVSTTLLAQVDAGIGGKNGVNLAGYKNLLGVFNQPRFVICDLSLLASLPEKEMRCGFSEIIKHALIADPDFFSFLEANAGMASSLEPALLEKAVHDSLTIKAGIVGRDERETGERRILNFGHTFGHALEATQGLSHGEAVSIGMAIAARLSCQWGYLGYREAGRIEALLARFGLPVDPPADPAGMVEAIRKDKNRNEDTIPLVLLTGVGRAIVRETRLAELESGIRRLFSGMDREGCRPVERSLANHDA